MKMKFIGEDGSMGFKKGKVYNISINSKKSLFGSEHIWIYSSIADVPYSSFKTLFENWKEMPSLF